MVHYEDARTQVQAHRSTIITRPLFPAYIPNIFSKRGSKKVFIKGYNNKEEEVHTPSSFLFDHRSSKPYKYQAF